MTITYPREGRMAINLHFGALRSHEIPRTLKKAPLIPPQAFRT